MKKWSFVALLLGGATILGATVFREPLAWAAQNVSATIVGPLDASGSVKVHEQGTANVNVTNGSLSIAPPAPITTGGGDTARACPDVVDLTSTAVATALSIHMDSGVAEVILETRGVTTPAARFAGPAAAGNASIVLALSRPVAFDRIRCIGTAANFSVSWVGS